MESGLPLGVRSLFQGSVVLSGELEMLSDPELSQSEWMESGREVTVCDYFTFFTEVSELEFRSLLEPRTDDTRGIVPVRVPPSSSTGKVLPH